MAHGTTATVAARRARRGSVRRAVVTGASSGIGAEFARQLAQGGSHMVLVARRTERLEALAAQLRGQSGVTAEVLPADLTDRADRAGVEARLSDPSSPVDLLVNSAGFGAYGRFDELSPGRQTAMVELNVVALVRLTHAAVAGMVARGHGGVINLGSTAGSQPDPFGAVYGATKAYVASFTLALHGELAGTAVRALVSCPGSTATEYHEVAGAHRTTMPDAAVLTPERVVATALRDLARGRAVSIPGLAGKATALGSDLAPDWLTRRLSARLHRKQLR